MYFWEIDDKAFAGCWLIQKGMLVCYVFFFFSLYNTTSGFATDVEGVRGLNNGFWNSIHVIEASEIGPKKYEYKLTTTCIVRSD